MKTETVKIKNGAGTIQSSAHSFTEGSEPIHIAPEEIEGQERIISSKIGAKFIYPDGLKYSIPDGLYEMEYIEGSKFMYRVIKRIEK